jgi:hypothetical protein
METMIGIAPLIMIVGVLWLYFAIGIKFRLARYSSIAACTTW